MSDYTDLAKALRCCIDDNIPCPDCPRFNKCMDDGNMSSLFSDAADAIADMIRFTRWIRVKDRLPEKQGEEYLVSISYPNGETDRVVLWYDLGIEPFFWNRIFVPRGTITYWMPLPAPPKEEV